MNEGGFLKPDVDTLVNNPYRSQVRWVTNSKGFRNSKEINRKKPSRTFRILSLGDSFTAGYRVAQSQTFSFLLEQQLNSNQDSINYEVVISNINNPVLGIAYINKHGLTYSPDIILLGITLGNDLTQSLIELCKDGRYRLVNDSLKTNPNYSTSRLTEAMEEFFPDNICDYSHDLDDLIEKSITLKFIKSAFGITSEGESIFSSRGKAYPYLHDHSHGLGLFIKDPPKSIELAYQINEKVLRVYQNIALKNGIRLIVCAFPQRYQINTRDWKKTIDDYDIHEQYFDITIANNRINSFCTKNNIEHIDITQQMKNEFELTGENLYMPMGDMHWNRNGHQIAFESIYGYLKPNNPISKLKTITD